jgi:hypothetical protein
MRNNIDTILSNGIEEIFEQVKSNMKKVFAKHQQKILSKQNEKNTNLVNMFKQFSNKQEENKNQQSAIKNYNLVDDLLDPFILDIEKCNIELNLEEQDDKQIDLPNSNDTYRSTQSKHRHPTQHKKSIKPNINSCRPYNLRPRPVKVEEKSNEISLQSEIDDLIVIAHKLLEYLQKDGKKILEIQKKLDEAREEIQKLDEAHEEIQKKLDEAREEIQKKLDEAREEIQKLNEAREEIHKSLLIDFLYGYIKHFKVALLKDNKLHDFVTLITKNNMGPKDQIVKDSNKLTIKSLLTQLQHTIQSNLEYNNKTQLNDDNKSLELIDQNVNIQGNNNSQNTESFQQFISVENISKHKQQGELQLKISPQ